jgi:hypothetical protein
VDLFYLPLDTIAPELSNKKTKSLDINTIDSIQTSYLFTSFAELIPSVESFLEFTNRWGLIKNDSRLVNIKIPQDQGVVAGRFSDFMEPHPYFMTIEEIRKAHRELRFAYVLWRLLNSNREDRLRQIFSGYQRSTEKLVCRCTDSITVSRHSIGVPSVYDVEWQEDVWEELLLADAANSHKLWERTGIIGRLNMPVTVAILLLINRHINTIGHTVTLLAPGQGPGLLLRVKPKNLLETMWFQFASAVTNRKPIERCVYCGKWGTDGFYHEKQHGYPYHFKCYKNSHVSSKKREKRAKSEA